MKGAKEARGKRTRSKSRASSRIRSLSNDERSLVCFQRGKEDLNSGKETTPGHVSSEGVPRVLKESVGDDFSSKRSLSTGISERVDRFLNHLGITAVWYTFPQIYNQPTKHQLKAKLDGIALDRFRHTRT